MTTVNPFMPDEILRDQPPVAICYTRNDKKQENPLHEVQEAFDRQREVWQTSEACEALQTQLTTLSLSRPITKIVCFGLGTLGRLNTRSADRSHTQHAAVATMVQALKARQGKRNEEIKCFAQDPAYDEVDMALLRSIGITPLDDPKGFLAVDESTLVFCVSPNVPVKQIIADVQWPAAMIWNTVRPSEPDVAKWEQRVRNGQVTWVWYVQLHFLLSAQRLTVAAPTPPIQILRAYARWSVITCRLQWLTWTTVSGTWQST
jgi:hypothetical protein